jgi:hypothetical protein
MMMEKICQTTEQQVAAAGDQDPELWCDTSWNRRRWMTAFGKGLAGLGLVTVVPEAIASDARSDLWDQLGLPQAWLERDARMARAYADYVNRINLRNMTVEQVLRPHFNSRGSVRNELPPLEMWRSIVMPLRIADAVAGRFKKRVRAVTSVYRSPQYNRACRGARNSYHQRNLALDVQIEGVAPRMVAAAARQYRSAGYFKGGIGTYSTFVHIDCRGTNVDF